MSDQDLIDGALDRIVAAWRQQRTTTPQTCHYQGCVFTKGHTIKHSWEYTK